MTRPLKLYQNYIRVSENHRAFVGNCLRPLCQENTLIPVQVHPAISARAINLDTDMFFFFIWMSTLVASVTISWLTHFTVLCYVIGTMTTTEDHAFRFFWSSAFSVKFVLKVFILYLLCSSWEQRNMVSVKRDSSYRIVAGTVREVSSGKQDKLCDNERIWLEWYGNACSQQLLSLSSLLFLCHRS